MKVALEVWSSDFATVEATCILADTLGIDAFYYGESPHALNLDCWTTLAALARSTTNIRLGPVIANVLPEYRSSRLLVRQAATVSAISGGRIDLRLGVGASVSFGRPWWEPHGIRYPEYSERLRDLEAALDRVDAMDPKPPVTIAARGDRAMALAAKRADVWETSFCTPAEYADRSDRFDSLAAGRPVHRTLEIDGFLAPTPERVTQLLHLAQLERSAEDLAPVIERALVGTAAEAAHHLRQLSNVGVDTVLVALHDPHDPDALKTLAEAVARSNRSHEPTEISSGVKKRAAPGWPGAAAPSVVD